MPALSYRSCGNARRRVLAPLLLVVALVATATPGTADAVEACDVSTPVPGLCIGSGPVFSDAPLEVISGGPGPHRITQQTTRYADIEKAATLAVAALHQVSLDRRVTYHARDEIRAVMFEELRNIAERVETGRLNGAEVGTDVPAPSASERAAYDALVAAVTAKRVGAATKAVEEYDDWYADPCSYDPPSGFGFDTYADREGVYNLCHTQAGTLLTKPRPPSAEEFTAYGLARELDGLLGSAEADVVTEDFLAAYGVLLSVLPAGLLGGAVAGIIGAVGAAETIATVVFPFAFRVSYALVLQVGEAAANAATIASGTTVTIASIGFAVGVALFAAVTIGIEIWKLVEDEAVPQKLDAARSAADDSFLITTQLGSDEGFAEIAMVFLAQTLPDFGDDVPSAYRPVPRQPGDPVFLAGSTATPELHTYDWSGQHQVTRMTADGWFVNRVAGGDEEYRLSIEVQDEAGSPVTIGRAGDRFIVTRKGGESELTDQFFVSTYTPFARIPAWVRYGGNHAPVVAMPQLTTDAPGGQPTVGVPFTLTVDATDRDGDDLTYRWEVESDGVAVCTGGGGCVATESKLGRTVTFTRFSERAYTGKVTVTDAHGASTSRDFSLPVAFAPIAVDVDARPASVVPGEEVTIAGTVNREPGFDLQVTLDWGDGSVETIGACASGCELFTGVNHRFAFRHTYGELDQDAVAVRITATDGGSTTTVELVLPLEGTGADDPCPVDPTVTAVGATSNEPGPEAPSEDVPADGPGEGEEATAMDAATASDQTEPAGSTTEEGCGGDVSTPADPDPDEDETDPPVDDGTSPGDPADPDAGDDDPAPVNSDEGSSEEDRPGDDTPPDDDTAPLEDGGPTSPDLDDDLPTNPGAPDDDDGASGPDAEPDAHLGAGPADPQDTAETPDGPDPAPAVPDPSTDGRGSSEDDGVSPESAVAPTDAGPSPTAGTGATTDSPGDGSAADQPLGPGGAPDQQPRPESREDEEPQAAAGTEAPSGQPGRPEVTASAPTSGHDAPRPWIPGALSVLALLGIGWAAGPGGLGRRWLR